MDNYDEENNNNNKCTKLEQKIQELSDEILKEKQLKFIKTAHHYNNNNLEKQLFNHFNDDINDECIIKYKDEILMSDNEIISKSMEYYKELYGSEKPLNCIKNDKLLINKIIENSYNYETNDIGILDHMN